MKKLKTIQSLCVWLMVVAFSTATALAQFTRGTLYHIIPAADAGKTVCYNEKKQVICSRLDDSNAAQHWTITPLAGAWRLINPFSNLALRTAGSQVATGENNGSDEAQLWKTESIGKDLVILVPANRPEVAAAIAANAVANTASTFLNIPANAVGMAALTVVGQCLGAGEKEQAVYYSRRLMLTAYCGAWVMNLSAFFFANRFAVSLFNLSPEAQAMALDIMVWFNIVSLFVWPSSFTLPNILRAAGDARFTMTVSIVSMWAFRVGFCYLAVLCFGGGLLSIWMGMYLDWVFRSLCFYLRFRRGSWLEQSVI